MDFEFESLSAELAGSIEATVNAELAADAHGTRPLPHP